MSLPRDVVLLLTHSADYFTVDRVEEALLRWGAKPFRLDTDKFPMDGLHHRLEYGERSVGTDEVQAVWIRRLWQPKLSQDLAPQFQESCAL